MIEKQISYFAFYTINCRLVACNYSVNLCVSFVKLCAIYLFVTLRHAEKYKDTESYFNP